MQKTSPLALRTEHPLRAGLLENTAAVMLAAMRLMTPRLPGRLGTALT